MVPRRLRLGVVHDLEARAAAAEAAETRTAEDAAADLSSPLLRPPRQLWRRAVALRVALRVREELRVAALRADDRRFLRRERVVRAPLRRRGTLRRAADDDALGLPLFRVHVARNKLLVLVNGARRGAEGARAARAFAECDGDPDREAEERDRDRDVREDQDWEVRSLKTEL